MMEEVKDDIQFSQELFNKSLNILKKKGGGKYDFLTKCGQSLKAALYNLFKVIWDTERKPDMWRDTILLQLYKGRGPRESLENLRNIHTKMEIPKFFGHIVTSAAKPLLFDNMSPFQIGTKPGHRAQEHLFVIKSIIGLAEHCNRSIALQLWDLSKYFDRENLADGLNEVYRNNVKGKLYKLLFELNKDTRISVRTPVGDTEWRETGEGWGQGTIEGAICSAVNLDNGVRDFFENSEYEVSYGDVPLSPTLFQDDISRLCWDPVSAQMGNDKVEAMAETKLLDFNLDKSCIIIIGKGKPRIEMEKQFSENPPLLYGQEMNIVTEEKYLGDQISAGGLGPSILATIKKRRGLVIDKIFEIKAVIDDCRSHVTGGIQTGLDIWEMLVIPYLTNNSESWTGLPMAAVEDLDGLQNLFYRVLLQVPAGFPKPMLYWDVKGLLMANRILKKKLLFLHHVATLDGGSIAHQVYKTQKRLQFPGLVEDCNEFLATIGISDVTKFSPGQWKSLVNKEIDDKNSSDLLKNMKQNYKKIDYKVMMEEKFEVKPYMKNLYLSEARDKFRLRSFMTRTVKTNFSSDKKYMAELWSCWHCPDIDSQAHIRVCPQYQKLRDNKDLDNDHDLVNYFREVIKMRDDMMT